MANTTSNGRSIAPTTTTGAEGAGVNVSAPADPTTAIPETHRLWPILCEFAARGELAGSAKSQFDCVSALAKVVGIDGARTLLNNREAILRQAAPHLKGVHTSKGVASVALSKALVAGIGDLKDKEAKKTCLGVWKLASALFALARAKDGEFGAGSFLG